MDVWHHRLDEHEFEQALGDSEGQGSLACCSLSGCKESDMTEQLELDFLALNTRHQCCLGKTEGRRRGQQRMRWLESIIDSTDLGLRKLF